MPSHFLRFLLFYLASLNAGLLFLIFFFPIDPEIPWLHAGEFYEEHPNYVLYLHRHDPARCTYYCETHACTHPKKLMAWYGPVRWQTLLLDPKSATYRQANVFVYVFALTLLWAWLGYYLLTGFRRITRRPHWLIQALFWLLLLAQVPLALVWVIPAQVSTIFDACVVFCVELAWALDVSLLDVYVLLFTFALPGFTVFLLVAALTRAVVSSIHRKQSIATPNTLP